MTTDVCIAPAPLTDDEKANITLLADGLAELRKVQPDVKPYTINHAGAIELAERFMEELGIKPSLAQMRFMIDRAHASILVTRRRGATASIVVPHARGAYSIGLLTDQHLTKF